MEINNRAEYQIHVLVTDRLTCEGKSKYQKIILCKQKTIKAGSLSADRMAPVCYSAPSITWSSKGELFVAWKRLRPKEHDKLPEFPITYVLKTDDTSSCNPIWVNAMNDVGQDQVLLLSDLHSTLISKPKSFMPILDESFFALHSGKFFIHYENVSNIKYGHGVWFKRSIHKYVSGPTTNMFLFSPSLNRMNGTL